MLMSSVSLASCHDDPTSEQDKVIRSIGIVENSIATTYTIHTEPDYSKLSIYTYNAAKEVISVLKASENKDSITYTAIDTSALTDKKSFEVQYKTGDDTFKATLDYKVIDVEYELNDWIADENYTRTVSTAGNDKLSDPTSGKYENDFIKAGKYYIGNENAVELLPTITGINPDDPMDIVSRKEIPDGTMFALTNEAGEKIELENALEDLENLKKNGLVKFKNSIEGVYTLTLSNPELDKTITYTMNVVSAYNVSKAIDVFALNNSLNCGDFGSAYNEQIKKFKTDNNLPDTNGLVFQNDITFHKSDLPEIYLWKEGEATDKSVAGSLKDWIGLVDHKFTENDEKVAIYGNCHRLMLDDNKESKDAFPYILTDSSTGEKQEAGKPISSHASFFYSSFEDGVDPTSCQLKIQDLEMSGNMGVSAESDITEGGPMFVKTSVSTTLDNIIASKVYIPVMIEGHNEKVDGGWYTCDIAINNSRFRDLFNSAVYVYGNGNMTINHSEMMKTGGPLLFLNPLTEELPAYPTDLSALAHTFVNIDASTVLSNYTEGKGGWFDAYNGASAIASNLKTVDQLFNLQCSTSFLKSETNGADSVSKFDFWMVSLPENGESIDLPVDKGGAYVNVTIGGKTAYSTLDGRDEVFQKAMAMAQEQNAQNVMAYVDSLTSTDFGNNLAYASTANEMTFRLLDDADKPHYAVLAPGANNQYMLADSKYVLLSALGMDVSSLSAQPNEVFQKNGTLACTINGAAQSSNPQNPSTLKGVCNYGLILGNYHTLA